MKPLVAALSAEQTAHGFVEMFAAALSRPAIDEAARPALAHFALRAALHPLLARFRANPLLTLNGRFISLDAQTAGLFDAAAASPLLTLSPNDRVALALMELTASAPSPPPSADNAGAVGTVAGAIYLPARRRATPCRVWAAYGAALPPGAAPDTTAAWPAPVAIRPVSPDVATSAQAALVAAVQTLEVFGVTARRALPPATLYYDICAPDAPDDVSASVSGPSLGLPLALAFVSALLQMPVSLSLAATGGVGVGGVGGDDSRDLTRVFPVDAVALKAACLERCATLLLVPVSATGRGGDLNAPLPQLRSVESVAAAARIALPSLAEWLSPSAVGRNTAPPVGAQVCFVVVGIENASRMWEDEAATGVSETLAVYDRLARETLEQSGGYTLPQRIGVSGDGICSAFADAPTARRAAVALLRVLRAHVWPHGGPAPPVRVGVHSGLSPYIGGGAGAGRGGATLNRAVLIMEAARGGQILISGAVADEISDGADEPGAMDATDVFDLREHGLFRLPDLAEPVRLVQVGASGLDDVRDAPRGLDAHRHNLPVASNPTLWGRDSDTARIGAALARTRLLTLTGPGGVGKTRLALDVAARLLDRFSGGVWLVPIGEAMSEDALGAALAAAMGAMGRTGGGESRAYDALARASGPVLLVLDECEAATDTVAVVTARLLENAPSVTALATSQTPLRLTAEQRFDVAPLSVPPSDAPAETLRDAPVVSLFVERAQSVAPDWIPSAADLVSVRLICERLDGLPLAVELAAARVRQMTPFEIGARLNDAFDLLTSRLRDAAPRHRAIETTLSWSWDLLDEAGRKAMVRLSVFGRGGFTREAGCAVVATGDISPLKASDLLDSLEEKSLLTFSPQSDSGERRFALRNLVRMFAARQSVEPENAAHAAHAAFFVSFAARWGPAEDTDTEIAAFDALDAEMENLRAAFAYLRRRNAAQLPGFVAALTDFLRRRGHQGERAEWTGAALAVLDEERKGDKAFLPLRARLLYARGIADKDARQLNDAEQRARESLALGRTLGDGRIVGDALNLLGLTYAAAKRYDDALPCHEEALKSFRNANWARGEATSLHNMALVLLRNNDRDRAQAAYEQAVPVSRASGDRHGLAYALINLAHIAHENGDLAASRALLEEALPVARELKDTVVVAIALANLGDVMDKQGDFYAAAPLLVAGEEIMTRLAHHHQSEFTGYVERCALRVGKERIAALRAEAARRTLPALRETSPPPPPRILHAR